MNKALKTVVYKIRSFVCTTGFAKRLLLFFGVMAGVLGLYTVLYYIIGPSEGYLHSDCTDSLFWALATYESGEVVSPDFHYAAILPFGASVWYIPLISLFGVSMKTQIIGMVIFALFSPCP